VMSVSEEGKARSVSEEGKEKEEKESEEGQ
jgi:hypothetical protein